MRFFFCFLLSVFLLKAQQASAQANASINVLTQNAGVVFQGGVIYIQVDVGNSGPVSSIGVNKVRAQISVPPIVQIVPNAQQDGLPAGWSILSNNGSAIMVCNGTDVIAVNQVRTILIKVRGVTLSTPLTVAGVLSFGPGTGQCTGPGALPGDITADNTSTSSISVIAAPSCILSVSATATDITCHGGTSTVTATVTGASGATEFRINNGAFQSSGIFTVPAGTHVITARETNNPNCSTTTSITLSQPPAVAAPLPASVVQPDCSVGTGSVQLTQLPAGSWTIMPGGVSGNTPTQVISGLAPGSYSFTVANAAGCVSSVSTAVVIDPPPPTPDMPVVTVTNPTCTQASGVVTISGSTAGLQYSLNNSAFAGYPAAGFVLPPGTYMLVARNSAGCVSAAASFTIGNQPQTPPAPTVGAIVHPNCTVSTGSVVLSQLPGGSWTIQPGSVTGTGASATVSALASGTYTFTVTNSEGCTSSVSATVVIDNVPGAPAQPIVNITQPDCATATGLVQLGSSTTGLTFSLNNGPFQTYPASGYALAPGTYSLMARNAGGCLSAPLPFTIEAQPATPAAPQGSSVHPGCSSGTGIIRLSSDTTTLLFRIDNGSFAGYPAGGFALPPGTYSISARNAAGCISPAAVFVINQPPVPLAITIQNTTVPCFGGVAQVQVSASGGVPPYQFSVNNGVLSSINTFSLAAGSHTVLIADAAGCTSTQSFTVQQPPQLTTSVQIDSIRCHSGQGIIRVSATGGTAPYTYSLNAGAFQTSDSFAVPSGDHSVRVRDAVGCTVSTTVIRVVQPPALSITVNAGRIRKCGGLATVTVSGAGGSGRYSGAGTFYRASGMWRFDLTDSAGCSVSATVRIDPPGCSVLIPFPNPARHVVNVHHSPAETGAIIRIYTSVGAQVMEKRIEKGQVRSMLDIHSLASGAYLIVFLNGDERAEAVFAKQ